MLWRHILSNVRRPLYEDLYCPLLDSLWASFCSFCINGIIKWGQWLNRSKCCRCTLTGAMSNRWIYINHGSIVTVVMIELAERNIHSLCKVKRNSPWPSRLFLFQGDSQRTLSWITRCPAVASEALTKSSREGIKQVDQYSADPSWQWHVWFYWKYSQHGYFLSLVGQRFWCVSLQWRHNEHGGISNHQPQDCLLNGSLRRRSKVTSKLRITGLCAWNSPVTGEFPAQRASNAENVSIWWRHHVVNWSLIYHIEPCAIRGHDHSDTYHFDAFIQKRHNSSGLATELLDRKKFWKMWLYSDPR